MIAGRTDLRGTAKAIIVVAQQGVLVVLPISGVGTDSYAQVPNQDLTSIQGWAAFRVSVP